ncbi:transcription factor HES-5-like [Discoglossus pictus]
MTPYNRMETSDNTMEKEPRKLRKPVIEKMRRDRINSSIEQLRILLEKEFHKQQLPSKPEKADILEMTVNLLRKQLQRASKAVAACNQMSPSITQDPVEFLPRKHQADKSMDLVTDTSRGHSLCQGMSPHTHIFTKQPAQDYNPAAADVWRPW